MRCLRSIPILCALALTAEAAFAVAQTPEASEPRPAETTSDLPAAKQIIDRAIEAMGGADAWKAIQSTHVKVRMIEAATEALVREIWTKGPDRIIVREVDSKYGDEARFGRIGDVAWRDGSEGVRSIPLELMNGFREMAEIHRSLMNIENDFGTVEVLGRETRVDEPCYKLRVADKKEASPSGSEPETLLFFNSDSGLPNGIRIVLPADKGGVQDIYFRKWIDVGDLHVFSRIELSLPDGPRIMAYDLIEFNTVDDSLFVVPEGLKNEAKKPGPDTADSDDPLARFTPAQRQQIEMQLKAILSQNDAADLREKATMMRSVSGMVPETDRPVYEYLLRRLDERIAELETARSE